MSLKVWGTGPGLKDHNPVGRVTGIFVLTTSWKGDFYALRHSSIHRPWKVWRCGSRNQAVVACRDKIDIHSGNSTVALDVSLYSLGKWNERQCCISRGLTCFEERLMNRVKGACFKSLSLALADFRTCHFSKGQTVISPWVNFRNILHSALKLKNNRDGHWKSKLIILSVYDFGLYWTAWSELFQWFMLVLANTLRWQNNTHKILLHVQANPLTVIWTCGTVQYVRHCDVRTILQSTEWTF